MFRWVKIFGDQYLGFWVMGLILFALQEVPYMVMPFMHLTGDPLMNMRETSAILDLLEKVLGIACILLMTFIVSGNAVLFSLGSGLQKAACFAAAAVLLLNYFGWGLYFLGHQSLPVILFFLVFLPPLYYICIGIWRGNPLLSVTGILFAVVHFVHVYGNLS